MFLRFQCFTRAVMEFGVETSKPLYFDLKITRAIKFSRRKSNS